MQKVNCLFKIRFKNDGTETPRTENVKILNMIETKWDIRICCQHMIFVLCSHTEKIRESMFIKYFKILLVSKS